MGYSKITSDLAGMVQDTIETYQINSSDSPRCIFYIDDSDIDRWLAKHIIETSGKFTQIVMASNGEEGMKAIKEYYTANNAFPEVIIVDLQMPRMGGFEFIRQIKNHPSYIEMNCIIILVSAGLDEEDEENIRELQIEKVLIKPLATEEVLKCI